MLATLIPYLVVTGDKGEFSFLFPVLSLSLSLSPRKKGDRRREEWRKRKEYKVKNGEIPDGFNRVKSKIANIIEKPTQNRQQKESGLGTEKKSE